MNYALLAAIVAAGPANFIFVNPNEALPLVNAGLIETNPNMVNDAGEIAARATEAGAKTVADMSAITAAPAASTPAPAASPAPATFVRASFVPPAKERKPREGGEKYPFGELSAPNAATGAVDAFFVPASADMPDPVKSLASAVSAANRRYATVTGTETVKDKDGNVAKDKDGRDKVRNVYKYNRKFEVFAGTADNTPNGQPGAWIGRTM